MQTKILMLSLLFLLSLQMQSQTTYEYLSRPGLTIASEHINWVTGTLNNTYKFVGDTLLCGENLLVYQRVSPSFSKILLRVDEGKVWRSTMNNPCNNQQLMYEFDLEVGDTTKAQNFNGYYVINIDTITLLNGEKRKQLFLTHNANAAPIQWIDGIGSLTRGLFPILDFEGFTTLICIKENVETIWINPNKSTEQCDSIACLIPVPDFNFEVDQFQVNFQNYSFNQTSVHWDFGDGQTSTELHPNHYYKNPGCYNVTLSLGTNCLTRTFKKKLSVPICIAQDWQVKTPVLTNSSIIVDFVNESTGWAIDKNRIWKTEDRGISWTEQFYPIPPAPVNRILSTIDMVDEMNGVIAVLNYSAPTLIEALLVTNDGGLNWKEKIPGSIQINSAIMTDDGQVFGAGQSRGLFYSKDWGNSFILLATDGISFPDFQYLGNNKVVSVGLQDFPPFATRVVSFSNNSGQFWKHNLLPSAYYSTSGFHFLNENEGFISGFDGFLIKTEDGGKSWKEIAYNDERKATKIYFVDEQTGWAVGNDGLVLSTTDGGNTWLVGNCGNRNNMLSISALNTENCWLGSQNGKYFELDFDTEVDCPLVNINELNLGVNKLLIYPNPTSETVKISFTKSNFSITNNRIIIYNNLGQNMYEGSIINETLEIKTQAWTSGVYWIKWFLNEQFFGTEKLIVLD